MIPDSVRMVEFKTAYLYRSGKEYDRIPWEEQSRPYDGAPVREFWNYSLDQSVILLSLLHQQHIAGTVP